MRGRAPEAEPEAGLGSGAQSADPAVAFRTFVATRWTALSRYAFLLTGDHHLAEDVVQTALANCWPRWGLIEGPPEPYVRAAIANTAASRGRRQRLPESSFEDLQERAPHLVAGYAAAGDLADDHAVRVGMWLALQDLPPRRRAVVVLRLWEDRSEAQTARILGISAGAVKSQLSKGLRQLRENPHTREYFDQSATNQQGER